MPNLNVNFNGSTLIIPAAYYADNVANAAGPTQPTALPLVFLGNAYGMKSFTPTTFTGSLAASQLLTALRGGPASGYVPFMTNPSGQLNGASQITFINVAPNTQSSATLNTVNSSGVINLTSANYGLPSNQLQVQVQTGTLAGKNVSLFDQYGGGIWTGSNLGVPMQLAYTGSGTGVTFGVVTSGTNNAVTLYTTSANPGESVSLSLGTYQTVEQLVNYFNGTSYYSAYALSNGALPSLNLDAVSGVSLASQASGVNQYAKVTATLTDIVWSINQYASGLATAVVSGATVSSSGVAPNNIPYTLFSGATNVTPSNTNYASGFNTALSIPAWVVFADSNASGVIALGTAHVATASSITNRGWRRFISGSSIGDSIAATLANAAAMNEINATFVYPGLYRTNTLTNASQLYGGLYAAAAVAGMMTGNTPATPLTNKSLTGNGVEVGLTVSQIDELQQGGVMPLIVSQVTGLVTICSDFTTWLNDANPENVFNQQVSCRYYAAYALTAATQPYAGTVASPFNETNALNAAKQCLNSLIFSQTNQNGVLSSWDPTTLQLIYTSANQLAAVTVNIVLVGQNRFITLYTNVLPLNLTITASSTGGAPT